MAEKDVALIGKHIFTSALGQTLLLIKLHATDAFVAYLYAILLPHLAFTTAVRIPLGTLQEKLSTTCSLFNI